MKKTIFNLIGMLSIVGLFSSCGGGGTPPPQASNLISFSQASLSVQENDGLATVNLELSKKSTSATTVQLSVSGTAEAGEDYEALTSQTISIPANAQSIDVDIALIDDALIELVSSKELELSLLPPSAGSDLGLGAQKSMKVMIQDDDLPTSISEGFGIDLRWQIEGRSVPFTKNNSNLDLQLFYYGPNGSANPDNPVLVSQSSTDFEFVQGPNTLADGVYGVSIFYNEGNEDLILSMAFNDAQKASNFTVKLDEYAKSQANNFTTPAKQEAFKEVLRFSKSGSNYSINP